MAGITRPRRHRASRTLARRDAPWIALDGLLIGVLLAAVFALPARINHDCALYLHQACLILEGGIPYRDFVDTNPPLIMYLNLPPVLLGRVLGVAPIPAFHVLVLLLLIVSAGEIHFLLRRPGVPMLANERGLVGLTWIGLFLVVFWRCETGQREHLFVLLYVPYLFLRIARYQGGSVYRWYALLLGSQAGLGASIKPHFLIMVGLVEVALAAATRWPEKPGKPSIGREKGFQSLLFAPENVALGLVVIGYAAHWLLVPEEMREAFFFRWLPMIRDHYGAYDVSYRRIVNTILRSPLATIGLLATMIATYLGVRFRLRLRNYLLAFAALAVLGLVSVFVQKKGFGYRAIPFETAAGMALALLAIQGVRMLRRNRPSGSIRAVFAVATLAAGCLLGLFAAWQVAVSGIPRSKEPPLLRSFQRILEEHTRPGDPVLFVATSVDPAYPLLVQMNRKPGSRYLCCFPIAFFYEDSHRKRSVQPAYRRWSDASRPEQQFLAELHEDVKLRKPRLIVIHDSRGWLGCPRWFNHFDYLTHSGWAAAALQSYREVAGPKGWKVFVREKNSELSALRVQGCKIRDFDATFGHPVRNPEP